MTKHNSAVIAEHIISIFMNIKKHTAPTRFGARIDELCIEGIGSVCRLSETEEFQKELDEVRKRRIDPTS